MPIFHGTYYCKMDAKGRVMLPVELRKQLSDQQVDKLVLKRAIYHNNLEMYPESVWEKLMTKLNKLNRFNKKNVIFLTRFLAGVRFATIDATGRMQIPKGLVNDAGLKKDIVITSSIEILEIWDKETYEKFLEDNTEGFEDLSEEVMEKLNHYDD